MKPKVTGKKNEEDKSLMQEIIHYLELHPNAADTLQGILKWWIKQQRNATNAEVLERNLNLLVEQKQLVITTSQSGEKIYKRAPSVS
jgi:hypothetical protein